jgi:PAS domain-containing protein
MVIMSASDASGDGLHPHAAHVGSQLKDNQHSPKSDGEQYGADYDTPISPLPAPSVQMDGLESIPEDSLACDRGRSPLRGHRRSSDTSSLHLRIPGMASPGEIAMAAMQYLPYPLMVLNTMKTIVMANESMGRLLGIGDEGATRDDEMSVLDRLRGKTLSQMGIDMLQDGRPIWVVWDSFLDAIGEEKGGIGDESSISEVTLDDEDETPTEEPLRKSSAGSNNSVVHDAVIEVVILPPDIVASSPIEERGGKAIACKHTFAKMIITVWELDGEKYFTLTFTSTESNQTTSRGSRQVSKASKRHSLTSAASPVPSSPSSMSSRRSSAYGGTSTSSSLTSSTNVSMSNSPFPPLGPPSRSLVNEPSILQKVSIMKDALLDSTEVPIIAMWKDQSMSFPNKAVRRLLHPAADVIDLTGGFDLLSQWHAWDETFTDRLEPSEYPISVLLRTQTGFSSRKMGFIHPETGRKLVLDCLGEAIRDKDTGEFLAGMVTCRDITSMTEQIQELKEKDEQRFQLICDSMPQMIWTTTADGTHDWFSGRW